MTDIAWPVRSDAAARLLAAGLALGLTLALLCVLSRPATIGSPVVAVAPAPAVLRLIAPTVTPSPAPRVAPQPLGPPPRRPVRRSLAPPAPRAAAPVELPLAIHSPALPPPEPAASAPEPPPLRLDPATLRRAAQDGRSEVQRLGERADRIVDPAPRSATERLGEGVAAGAKPACIAPDPGGSLLSIPLIAYRALTGHCR